jgi:hypothetical protein
MRLLRVAALTAFGLGLIASPARADGLPPPVPPAKDVKFTVELDEKAKAPKLIVPVGMTRAQFRPRGPKQPAPGKEPVAYLEFEADDAAPAEAPRNPNHLMIAGVALTLALGLGGVWLVRRQGRTATRGLLLLLAAGGTLAASTVVWANVAPAPPPPKKELAVLPVAFDGKVNLEMVGGGDTIRLVLDKETYERVKKEPKAPEGK